MYITFYFLQQRRSQFLITRGSISCPTLCYSIHHFLVVRRFSSTKRDTIVEEKNRDFLIRIIPFLPFSIFHHRLCTWGTARKQQRRTNASILTARTMVRMEATTGRRAIFSTIG
ncbi:hypothetical protein PanWU01x14_199610, partial [Parasponia andersonii]